MSRKLFDADSAVDAILEKYSKITGVKIGKAINMAVYNDFLPRTAQTLRTQASYVLEEHMKNLSKEDEKNILKDALSRSISFLKKYPIEDNNTFKEIISHYQTPPFNDSENDQHNEYVKRIFDKVKIKLAGIDDTFECFVGTDASFAEQILFFWNNIWKESEVYDIISYVVYNSEITTEYDWYDTISWLKDLDIQLMYEYRNKDIQGGNGE